MEIIEELPDVMLAAERVVPGISNRALIEAARRTVGRAAPYLVPATSGCPACGTERILASPSPLGSCDECGTPLEFRRS
jgi:hypothetical protein